MSPDGAIGNLAEAVDQMGLSQLNKQLTDENIKGILRFLTTLADGERTTAPPLAVKASSAAWVAPLMTDVPQG